MTWRTLSARIWVVWGSERLHGRKNAPLLTHPFNSSWPTWNPHLAITPDRFGLRATHEVAVLAQLGFDRFVSDLRDDVTYDRYTMTTSSTSKKRPPHQRRLANEPLFGFVPRRVTAKQVEVVLVSDQFSRLTAIWTMLPVAHSDPFVCGCRTEISIPSATNLTQRNTERFLETARGFPCMPRSFSSMKRRVIVRT